MRPGRTSSVSFDQVVAAAVALADAEGLDAVTFRALARDLGVSPMAVHRTTGGMDQLRHALVSRSVGDAARGVQWPSDWPGVVRVFADGLRALLLRHPAVLEAHRQAPLNAPGAAEVVERVLTALQRSGLDERRALDAYQAVHDYVTGHVAMQLGRGGPATQSATPAVEEPRSALPDAPDYDARFRMGIDLLLRGVQVLTMDLAPRPPGAVSRTRGRRRASLDL